MIVVLSKCKTAGIVDVRQYNACFFILTSVCYMMISRVYILILGVYDHPIATMKTM
jgi:hypothetical protein